ncbi:MAG: TonB-dependent receptor [Bacteroidota bacterium]
MKQFTFFFLAFFMLVQVMAQQGAVTGTIIDEDAFPLIGANVVIEGTTIGGQTDFDGKFSFKAEPGTYTLVASYIGYADNKIFEVAIAGNETTIVDIVMKADGGVNLEEIVVQATRVENSENAVLMIRKGSDKVQDVISSQEMSRLGASNAASALTKVTGTTIVDGKYVYVRGLGDRYSATTLNGLRLPSIDPYRNTAQLDLIPASVVDNIITSKTFTPDLPGDFTGGSVNLKLKSLPERFTWGVSVSTAFNPQNNLRDDFLTWDAGGRARSFGFSDGSLDEPSILLSDRLDELNILDAGTSRRARRDDEIADLATQAINSFNKPFEVATPGNSGLDFNISLNVGNQFELGNDFKIGLFATGTYAKDYSQYRDGVRGNYFASVGGSDALDLNFNLSDHRSVESPSLNGMVGISLRPGNRNKIDFYTLYSHQADVIGRQLRGDNANYGLGGETYYEAFAARFREREMTSHVLSGLHRLGKEGDGVKVEWTANLVNSFQNEPDFRQLGTSFDGGFQINFSQYAGPQRFFRDLTDQTVQGKIDLTFPILKQAGRGNFIKIGGSYNNKTRDFNERIYEYRDANALSFGEVDGDPSAYFAPGNSGLIGEASNGNNILGLFLIDASSLSNSYGGKFTGFDSPAPSQKAQSEVAAGYAMATLNVTPRLKAIIGARLEQTYIFIQSDVVANEYVQSFGNENREPNEQRIADNTANIDTAVLLPALNLVYAISEYANLRLSFTQTLARPNMREVAPFGSFGFPGEPPVFGNPDLRQTRISNYDLRYEFFPERGGEVFAISAFYKDFKDPIVTTFRQAGQPQFTWTNSESARLYGVELEFKKRLDIISPELKNFSFSGNFSYIQSTQDIDSTEFQLAFENDPTASRTRSFNGQSDFIANANLSYTTETGWDAILAYNYFSNRLRSIGAVGTPDIFEQGRSQLDLSVSKTFNKLKATLRVRNLTNPEFKTFSEFNGVEYIFTRFERGREVSLSLGYKF